MMKRRDWLLTGLAGRWGWGWAQAGGWPQRPVRWIVPFPPGGTTDAVSRLVATEMTRSLGQAVVVENRPGGGTVIGVDAAVKAPADGYTVVCVANSFCVNHTLVRNLPYDTLSDLRPVGLMGMSEHVLVTHSQSGFKTLSEFMAVARQKPGKLGYASFGNGTSAHLAGAMLEAAIGVPLIHVPYKGQAPAMNDVLGGQVDLMFGNWPEFRQHVQSGKLVALGMATAQRSAMARHIPTLTEQGLAIESNSWNGVLVRSGVPDAVVERLNAEIQKALQAPTVVQAFREGGITSMAGTPVQFERFIRSEVDKYAGVIRKAGITV